MAQQQDLVKVVTTLGTRFYPLGTMLYASAGGNSLYFHSQVSDISVDATVRWHNEHIDAKFEEVVPHLSQSPRYTKAEETVISVNSAGVKIPQFRIQLIRALAAKSVVADAQDLEQKIMKEGRDFTPEEHAAMKNYLYDGLQKKASGDDEVARSQATIDEWLRGKTVCVMNPKLLLNIAQVAGSPTIAWWYAGVGKTGSESSGFWREYKFYTMLRQGIMRYLNGRIGELRPANGDEPASQKGIRGYIGRMIGKLRPAKGNGFDMTLEIQLVLNQFMERVNEKFSHARVLSVERVGVAGAQPQNGKPVPNLTDGAYVGKPTQDMTRVSLSDIISETNLVDGALASALLHYFDGITSSRYKVSKDKEDNKSFRTVIAKFSRFDYFVRLRNAGFFILNTMKELGLTGLKVADSPEIVRGVGMHFAVPGEPGDFNDLFRNYE